MRISYVALLVGGVLGLYAEPSAFDLQSGATKQELSTLKSSNKNLENIIATLKSQTDTLLQNQDGLRSLFEGQGAKLKEVSDTLNVHDNTLKALKATQDMQDSMLKQQGNLIEALKSQIEANKNALSQLDQKINDMNAVLTKMNTDFATKLEAIQDSIREQADDNAKKLKSLARIQAKMLQKNQAVSDTKQNEIAFEKDPDKKPQIFQEALGFYRQKRFDQAQVRFAWLGDNAYKSAYSYYMAGEAAYLQKKYKDAIALYKKSALIKDKADYMPVLLWHTAWAFRFLGDHSTYIKFLRSLSSLYPESEQGKKALGALGKEKQN
ncbi:hypothetical protein ACFOPX_03020 [Helicobacter baculiformis]|uniref:Periplasmic protein n=1 Tax=Helicobacter baculiformis TaxID=427351 RepID=A0ABV7ZH69_9HELI|nr:hypothetical protein [Helicobacter baculiformis]